MKKAKHTNFSKNRAIIYAIIVLVIIIAILAGVLIFKNLSSKKEQVANANAENIIENEDQSSIIAEIENVDIVDINSPTRPYAVTINNTPVAVKVQEGLNKAYLVYEIPTEGNTSRLLALYKDIKEDLVLGTIRSARHNFIDFALESDAIFCCFGWSHYAEDDLKAGSIDYLQGLYGEPYYRNNPENLASEHTAYTSISKLNSAVQSKGMRTTSNSSILLNYNVEDTDLSSIAANTITIPYGSEPNVTSFKYNEETKMYTRYESGNKCIDHNTKEEVTTKNIIIEKVGYRMCDDNYYWNLYTTGTGEGYFITNGYAVPITWNKASRNSKTKYTYKEGTTINGEDVGGQEISVSDGRTYIELQTTEQKLTIE